MLSKKLILVIIIYLIILFPSIALAGDENELKELCKQGGIVELEAKTYTIDNSFDLPSNIELRGREGTIFKFANECGIPQNIPMISGKNQKNITITGIRFEGNQDHQNYALNFKNPNHPEQSGKKAYGNQIGTFIYLINCENIKVTNCAFNDNLGDGLRCSGCKNIEFSYNTGEKGGHDAFFALRSSYVWVHNNNIKARVNSACRLLSTSHVRIYENVFTWEDKSDSGPLNQNQNDNGVMEDIEICNNLFINACCPGIWLVDKTGGNSEIWIHHNLFLNCGDNRISWVGGILSSGYDNLKIENNVFDGCYRASIVFFAVNQAWATEAKAELTENIFTNARKSQLDGRGPYGVDNTISKQKVKSSKNCYYNNDAGNTYGCKVSDSDIFVNPKEHDTPSGWTWDGKEWSCPEVKPSEMDVPEGFKPLSDKDIENADKSALDFDVLFNLLNTNYCTQVSENETIILPEGVKKTPSKVLGKVEYYKIGDNYTTFVKIPSKGLSEVQYEVQGKTATHTLMIGEKTSEGVVFTETSIWGGELEHRGEALKLDGKVSLQDINVVCITPTDSTIPILETSSEEFKAAKFHPAAILLTVAFILAYFFFRFSIRHMV